MEQQKRSSCLCVPFARKEIGAKQVAGHLTIDHMKAIAHLFRAGGIANPDVGICIHTSSYILLPRAEETQKVHE